MKKLNNNGITLMALVITIIILIILASIGTYSGIQVVKSAQFTAFSTELKIMQTQVNKLYEEKKNGNGDVNALGKTISSSSTTVQSNATKAFNASGIRDTSDYKYFDTDTIKSLNIEGVEGEFFVNIDKRSVVSYDGFEYEGKTYYTLEQLPDGLYNVEHNTSEQQPDFNVDYELLENGKCKISVNNINYNGNINKWQVKYKKEYEDDWKTTNNYSFTIDEVGNYRVKIANNNTESREKQIVAKTLPSEYQQVEYIESTRTQYIDTGVYGKNNMVITSQFEILSGANYYYLFGANNSSSTGYPGIAVFPLDKAASNMLTWRYGNSTIEKSNIILDYNKKYNLELSYRKLVLDNTTYNAINSQNWSDLRYSLYLFACNMQGSTYDRYTNIKLYKLIISENNELIRNFIPCYRKSDNKPGLYDLVNNVFYTNQGTGDFERGKDIDSGETINTIIINNL